MYMHTNYNVMLEADGLKNKPILEARHLEHHGKVGIHLPNGTVLVYSMYSVERNELKAMQKSVEL